MTVSKAQLKIKSGDTVKVLRGKDAGKTGKVSQVFPAMQMVVVDGVNKMVRHLRSQRRDEKGQRVDFFGPLQVSKVSLVCPLCNKPTRVGYKVVKGEDGKVQKLRLCKKCNQTF